MTGDKVSDPSDAAGTLWLDVAKRDWSDTLLAACDMNRSQMPRLVKAAHRPAFCAPTSHAIWSRR